jgi:hypothetical protein
MNGESCLLVEHLEVLNRTAFFLTNGKGIELDDAVQLTCKRILERCRRPNKKPALSKGNAGFSSIHRPKVAPPDAVR